MNRNRGEEHRRDEWRRSFASDTYSEPEPLGDEPDRPPQPVHLACPANGETTSCATCGCAVPHRFELLCIPEPARLYRCELHRVQLVRVNR
jgi:hypothetical protein